MKRKTIAMLFALTLLCLWIAPAYGTDRLTIPGDGGRLSALPVETPLSFETMDVSGRPVASSDLFSPWDITIVYCWNSAAEHCREDLPILAQWNQTLSDIHCSLVGLIFGSDDGEEQSRSAAIARDCGVDFPLLTDSEALRALFPVQSLPTAFFVDKNGQILGDVLPDARPEDCEAALAALLNAKTAYRVICADEIGQPVPEVWVQFCDDSLCWIGETDADGAALFQVPQGEYRVHLLSVPEGFSPDEAEYAMPADYGTLRLTLHSAK